MRFMEQSEVIKRIKEVAAQILPEGSSLWLYGSRARGDAHPYSDYDLLILLNKDVLTLDDYRQSIPLRQLGWSINETISPQVDSKTEWEKYHYTLFYDNVEHDKRILL